MQAHTAAALARRDGSQRARSSRRLAQQQQQQVDKSKLNGRGRGSPRRQVGKSKLNGRARGSPRRPWQPPTQPRTFCSGWGLWTTAFCASITKRVISYVITPSTRLRAAGRGWLEVTVGRGVRRG